jgi:hypothetical protein
LASIHKRKTNLQQSWPGVCDTGYRVPVLKRSVFLCAGLLIGLSASTTPLSLVVMNASRAQAGHLPDGWQVKVTRGTPEITLVTEPERSSVKLKSRSASFALERGLDVDVNELPYLAWSWKVTELPQNGDFRKTSTDDQAAQVLVGFADRKVLTYIWDSTAPKGTFQSASTIPFVHVWALVCQSGQAQRGQWISEVHNVVQDFQRAYGHKPAKIKGIRLQINSQHTASTAESQFGEIAFRATP